MKFIIEGREAAIKSGSSFDFVFENRMFSDSDNYTLSISFPMAGCTQNLAIFGHINRPDLSARKVALDCIIVDRELQRRGVLAIVELTDKEVKGQFLEGRSVQNYNTSLDDVSINRLDLGRPPKVNASEVTPAQAWSGNGGAVALPWINDAYPTVPNNWVDRADTDSNRIFTAAGYKWNKDVKKLSWMPYLIEITKRICDKIGYTYDFQPWEADFRRNIIICNTLPASWEKPDYRHILPDWSVPEFFQKLELFLGAFFDFDYYNKHVKMSFAVSPESTVEIRDVVSEFSASLDSLEKDSDYKFLPMKRVAYKKGSHELADYYVCDWIFKLVEQGDVVEYDSLTDLINANKRKVVTETALDGKKYQRVYYGDPGNVTQLLFDRETKTYFCMRSIGCDVLPGPFGHERYFQRYILQPVNVFGAGRPEQEGESTEEIEFVPACVTDTYISDDDDMGNMMRLSISADNAVTSEGGTRNDAPYQNGKEIRQAGFAKLIEAGENTQEAGYYDVINFGLWDFNSAPDFSHRKSPCPAIDRFSIGADWSFYGTMADFRLYNSSIGRYTNWPQVDSRRKYTFKWLADSVPAPRAIFHIRGKRYVCEKITATFAENGMSQLLKGEFYPLLDDQSAPS